MGEMFKQVFAAIAMLFSAVEGFASAANNLAVVADETSGEYVDERRHSRLVAQRTRQREIAAEDAATATPQLPA